MSYDNFEKLPPALNDSEIINLFAKYHRGDEDAFDTIITHNLRLISYIISKQFSNTSLSYDDLFSVGTYGLIKACKTFDETKGIKFSTFASRVITNEILMLLRKEKKHDIVSSYNVKFSEENGAEIIELFASDDNIEEFYLNNELKKIVENIIKNDSGLTSQEKLIINYLFGINGYLQKKQSQIAETLKLSQSYISRIYKRALIKIREDIRQYGYDIKVTDKKKYLEKSSKSIYEMFSEYSQVEIDEVINNCLSPSENKILLNRFGNDLENPKEVIEWDSKKDKIYFSIILPKIKTNLEKIKKSKNNWNTIVSTLYDVFRPYSKRQIDLAITKLKDNEKAFLKKCYGDDYNNTCIAYENLNDEEKKLLKIITKKIIDTIIENNKVEAKKPVIKPKPEKVKRLIEEEKPKMIKMIDFWQDDTFIDFLKESSWEEIVIVSLKFGLVAQKRYSTGQIATLLGYEYAFVQQIISNFLSRYKSKINNYFENIIEKDLVRRRN